MKMPRITEAEFTNQVLQLARLRGWRTAHFRPARTAAGWRTPVQGDGKGWPDLVLVRRERIVVVELKRSKKERLRPEQADWIWALEQTSIEVAIWTPEDWPIIEKVLA